ncbi:MAG: SDR family oxidoreductase [Pseudomonadota bacterium]
MAESEIRATAEEQPAPVAVIHGASGGVGGAAVEYLLEQGRFVFATCRNPDGAHALIKLGRAFPRHLEIRAMDLTSESSVRAAAAHARGLNRPLDLMLNCVGLLHAGEIQPERRLSDFDPEIALHVLRVNAVGPLLAIKHFSPLLERTRQTIVANISARVGSIGDNKLGGWYSYRGSKAALNMFTRNAAIELRRRYPNVVCVALHPGTVATALSDPFTARLPAGQLQQAEQSAANLFDVIGSLKSTDNGQFFAWDGARLPW